MSSGFSTVGPLISVSAVPNCEDKGKTYFVARNNSGPVKEMVGVRQDRGEAHLIQADEKFKRYLPGWILLRHSLDVSQHFAQSLQQPYQFLLTNPSHCGVSDKSKWAWILIAKNIQ